MQYKQNMNLYWKQKWCIKKGHKKYTNKCITLSTMVKLLTLTAIVKREKYTMPKPYTKKISINKNFNLEKVK